MADSSNSNPNSNPNPIETPNEGGSADTNKFKKLLGATEKLLTRVESKFGPILTTADPEPKFALLVESYQTLKKWKEAAEKLEDPEKEITEEGKIAFVLQFELLERVEEELMEESRHSRRRHLG